MCGCVIFFFIYLEDLISPNQYNYPFLVTFVVSKSNSRACDFDLLWRVVFGNVCVVAQIVGLCVCVIIVFDASKILIGTCIVSFWWALAVPMRLKWPRQRHFLILSEMLKLKFNSFFQCCK